MIANGEEYWLTYDGSGCGDARGFTDWDSEHLVTEFSREEADRIRNVWRVFYRNQGQRFRFAVRAVFRFSNGRIQKTRHPQEVFP